jgi:hypothetical protein
VSVPSLELGPQPLPSECASPPTWVLRGSLTCLRGKGWGRLIRTTGQKAWHSVYSVSHMKKERLTFFTAQLPIYFLLPQHHEYMPQIYYSSYKKDEKHPFHVAEYWGWGVGGWGGGWTHGLRKTQTDDMLHQREGDVGGYKGEN